MGNITYTVEELNSTTDTLLSSVTKHLSSEYERGRLTGANYAQAYTSAIQSAMQQAQAFLLAKDIAGSNADTAAEQALQAVIQTEIATATKQSQIDLVAAQKDTAEEELKVLKERHGMNYSPEYTQGA